VANFTTLNYRVIFQALVVNKVNFAEVIFWNDTHEVPAIESERDLLTVLFIIVPVVMVITTVVGIEVVVEVLVLWVVLPVLLLAHLSPPLSVEELRSAIMFVFISLIISIEACALEVGLISAVLTLNSALVLNEVDVIAGRLSLNQVAGVFVDRVVIGIQTEVQKVVLRVVLPELLLTHRFPEAPVQKAWEAVFLPLLAFLVGAPSPALEVFLVSAVVDLVLTLFLN
jgi:hypothetical protein